MIATLVAWALAVAAGPTPPDPPAAGAVADTVPRAAGLQAPLLAIRVDSAAGYRPVLRVGAVLDDPALQRAVRSGLPLRLRFRTDLWRDGFIDNLAGSESWTAVLAYEPLEDRFIVRAQASPVAARTYTGYDAARAAVERAHRPRLRPDRPGRYYYIATLEVETLSLSDLEELEQWLRGELRPAVGGERSLPGAVGEGAKRLLIRMLRLPARRIDARSEAFRIR